MKMKLKIFWIKLKSIVRLPIYRKDVLIWTKYYYANSQYISLCYTIDMTLRYFFVASSKCKLKPRHKLLSFYMPLFTPENAKKYMVNNGLINIEDINYSNYWWERYTWELNGGRLGFLNWMIEQYKDDKTNLRKL